MDASEALRLQAAMGYGLEDTQMIIESMAQVRCAVLCCACCAALHCAALLCCGIRGLLWRALHAKSFLLLPCSMFAVVVYWQPASAVGRVV